MFLIRVSGIAYRCPALIDQYDHCHAYYGGPGYTPGNSPFAVIFWSIDSATSEIDIGLTCSFTSPLGFCALGITNSDVGQMTNSDPIINFWDSNADTGACGDYHIGDNRPATSSSTTAYPTSDALGGNEGVNRDVLLGGTNDVSNCAALAEFNNRKLVFTFTRPLAATDQYDIAIPNQARIVLIAARIATGASTALGYHTAFHLATDSWNFNAAPSTSRLHLLSRFAAL